MRNEPLGLPKGSIRAIITLLLLGMLGMTIFYDVDSSSMAVVAGLAGTSVSSYFGSRRETNGNDNGA